MNLPNKLTIFRMILTIILIGFFFVPTIEGKIIILTLFIIATLTDFLDGFIARKYNLITDFGKIMDPIADKFLIISVFTFFYYRGVLGLTLLIIIIMRDIGITGLRLYYQKKGIILAAENMGKIKTVLQIIVIIAFLFFDIIKYQLIGEQRLIIIKTIDMSLKGIVVITVLSVIYFLWNNKGIFNEKRNN